jgi:hypothetical protein
MASIFNTIKGVMETLEDPDTSSWEKLSSVLMGIGTIIPMITMMFNKNTIASYAAAGAHIA